mgnify:CR=1 FL=1
MSELIKAYTDELDLIYDQIEILWAGAEKDENSCFTKDFTDKIDYLSLCTVKPLHSWGGYKVQIDKNNS